MKLEMSNVEVERSDELEEMKYSLDDEQLPLLFKLLRTSLYSDKIGAIVREVTSNCWDAHAEAGVDRKVRIVYQEKNPIIGTQPALIFRDFGIGLSPTRMQSIFCKYLSSTKRGDNGQIGGFGIGSKSPFSYSDSFHVVTIHEGIKYTYLAFIDESQLGAITKLAEEETDEEQGTQILITLKSSDDFSMFKQAFSRQLAYFDNIEYVNFSPSFVGTGDEEGEITVVKKKNFVFNPRHKEGLKILIGNVAYPMPQERHSQYDSDTNYALRFEIGELPVTPAREHIELLDGVLDKIDAKKALAVAEIMEEHLESLKNADYMDTIVSMREAYVKKTVNIDGHRLYLGTIPSAAIMPAKGAYPDTILESGLSIKGIIEVVNELFDVTHARRYSYSSSTNYNRGGYLGDGLVATDYPIVYFEDNGIQDVALRYLVEQNIGTSVAGIRNRSLDKAIKSLAADTYPTDKERDFWTPILEKFQTDIVELLRSRSRFEDYETLKASDKFREFKKLGNLRGDRDAGEIPCKMLWISTAETWDEDRVFGFTMHDFDLEKSYPGTIIYGSSDDAEGLKGVGWLFHTYRRKHYATGTYGKKIIFLKVSKQNGKKIAKNFPNNSYNVKEFMGNSPNLIAAIGNYELIKDKLESIGGRKRIDSLQNSINNLNVTELVPVYEDLKAVQQFLHKVEDNGIYKYLDDKFVKECCIVTKQMNLYNKDLFSSYQKCYDYFNNLAIFDYAGGDRKEPNDDVIEEVKIILKEKHKKLKINS